MNRFSILFCAAVFFPAASAINIAAQNFSKSPDDAPFVLVSKEITGAWNLNDAESDDAVAKVQTMLAKNLDAAAQINASQKTSPAISISLFHPDSVVIAAGDDSEITINQVYQEVVQTKTVIPDGAVRFYELSPGIQYSVTASRQKGDLKVETVSPRGNRMIEIYTLAKDGKLGVSMRIENPQGAEIITMHRVYDRAPLNILSGGDDEEMQ